MTGTTEIRHRTQTENNTEKMNNNHQQTIEDIRRETRLLTYREQERINIYFFNFSLKFRNSNKNSKQTKIDK